MTQMPVHKYRPYPTVRLPDRQWPDRTLDIAPTWCSVDLRDGNQALIDPMTLDEKLRLFELLVKIGFKEIEIGFPSAAQVEFDFTRLLIEEKRVPDDVALQVLVQARQPLIEKTFEALQGAKKAIVHVYNSTSEVQRRVVFRKGRAAIKDLAIEGAQMLYEGAKLLPDTDVTLEYSPESFTATELEYALDVCEAVIDVWKPTPDKKCIINLPATVELSTPNVYADRIEWFCKNVKNRDSLIISLHTHNDRGTGVAASELGLMAGGDRVEGTLFGNGERTGNCDLVTLALNFFAQGVDPELNFSHINEVRDLYMEVTKLPIHPRHPYVGELVYTAFSGSHQDAISKGMHAIEEEQSGLWEVPYLPIDPSDVGRSYESIIRINSQSGKGGVAWIMESEYGIQLPKPMHPEFGRIIQQVTDIQGTEVQPQLIWDAFEQHYLKSQSPIHFKHLKEAVSRESQSQITVSLDLNGKSCEITGVGEGPLEAFSNGIREKTGWDFQILSFDQHALEKGSEARAVTFICIEKPNAPPHYGVGIDKNISLAAMKALVSALNQTFS